MSAKGFEVTVRVAGPADALALSRLAALDSAAVPTGPTLVAEVDGQVVAALPVGGGAAVADPFRHTASAVSLLELRAAQIHAASHPPGSRASRLRRPWALRRAPRAAEGR